MAVICFTPHGLSSAGQAGLVFVAGTEVKERQQRMQGLLNWHACYFHSILLAKQLIRPAQESQLAVLRPVKLT